MRIHFFVHTANSRSRSYSLLRFVIGPVGSKQVINVDARAAYTTSTIFLDFIPTNLSSFTMGNVILQSSTVSDEYTYRGVTAGMVRVQHNAGIAKQGRVATDVGLWRERHSGRRECHTP